MSAPTAVIFDLDGVLTDTISLHFESWKPVAAELEIPFDGAVNDTLRGLSRMESLERLLGERSPEFSAAEKQLIAERKNDIYLKLVARMTPADLFSGIEPLLRALRSRGFKTAVASSSRNAAVVIERLGIAAQFDAIVDANDVQKSKPDPAVFLEAARRLGVSPGRCVVIEDGTAGIAAARAAGMMVIGVGDAARDQNVTRYVRTCDALTIQLIANLLL